MYTINTTGSYRNPWGLFLGSQCVSMHPSYAAALRAMRTIEYFGGVKPQEAR